MRTVPNLVRVFSTDKEGAMKLVIVISLCILTFAVLAVGQATHTNYTFTSYNRFWNEVDPVDPYVTHVADGWIFVKDLPIVGAYSRVSGSNETGNLYVEASGKLSLDGADGNFHGTVVLYLIEKDMTCRGRFSGKRIAYFETLKWVLNCPDGSKIHERAGFLFDGSIPWRLDGEGTLLEPQN
jgi:hypothetical protein